MSDSSSLWIGGKPTTPSPTSGSALQNVFADNPAASSAGMTPHRTTVHQQAQYGSSWQASPENRPMGSDGTSPREIPVGMRPAGAFKQVDFGAEGLPDCMLKLVIIGDSGVGKSSLLNRFATRTYSDAYISTVGVDFINRRVEVDGRGVEFQLWDTAGQERFRTIMSSYYRGAQGILIVYDTTNMKSFNHLDQWLEDVDKHAGKSCKRVLLGNKCDMRSAKAVDFETATAWAVANEIELFETSAKEGHMVDETFISLARQIIAEGGADGSRRRIGTVGLQSIAGPGSNMPGQQQEGYCC